MKPTLHCVAVMQLWRSVRDFMEQSRAWTEESILDDDGQVLLNVESVRQEVEDYAAKAYKAAKANKDVSQSHSIQGSCLCQQCNKLVHVTSVARAPLLLLWNVLLGPQKYLRSSKH